MKLRRLFAGICLLFPVINGQILSMTVCSDDVCEKDCVSWSATSGKCSPCQSHLGDCSVTNPSSIVTTSYITLYSDSTCQKVISGTMNMPLLMDSGCNLLVATGSSHIGSYKASNTSAIIGGFIGGLLLLIGLCICGCCLCKRWKLASQNNQNDVNSPPSAYHAPLVPYPMYISYSSPPTIQQTHYYPTYVPHYYETQEGYNVAPVPSAPVPSAPPANYSDYPSKSVM